MKASATIAAALGFGGRTRLAGSAPDDSLAGTGWGGNVVTSPGYDADRRDRLRENPDLSVVPATVDHMGFPSSEHVYVPAYLARLGLEHEPPSVDALFRLHKAHVERVPYEDFEVSSAG